MQIFNKNWHFGLAGLLLGAGITAAVLLSQRHDATAHAGHEHTTASDSAASTVWTCSMHPSVRQNEPGDCPLCGMDLIPADEGSDSDPLVLEMTDEAVKLAQIQTTVLGTQSRSGGGAVLQLSGKVQADERLASSQVAQFGGRIEKLYVSFTGEQVRRGQKLADIYAPELITAQRELLEAKKLATVNPNLLEAARSKLRYWKIGPELIEEIENSATIRETFPVIATESGVVTNRRVAVGDYVRQGEALFDLMGLNRVWVMFDAYEEDLANIKLGSKIDFTTPALPGTVFTAPVRYIDPFIKPQTRTASVRVELANPRGQLKPEMLVSGSVAATSSTSDQLMIPKSAVLWTGPRSVVYLKVPEQEIPTFQFREIELGEAVGDQYLVLAGLATGDEVVTHGGFVIDAAAQLNNQASMMNKDVAVKSGEATTAVIPDFTGETPEAFQLQLENLLSAYLQLKDALVETDAALAATGATQFSEQLSQLDMSLLDAAGHEFWMEQLPALKAHSNKIRQSTDVETQRTQFDFLSQAMIQTIKAFGVNSQAYYVQYCPMAFNDEGAAWLSDEDQVMNPYFGDVMLRCGIIQENIEPTD